MIQRRWISRTEKLDVKTDQHLESLINELKSSASKRTQPNWESITDLIYLRLKESALRIAGYQPGDPSFGPSALVNETFLKFAKFKDFGQIEDVSHFLALFATMMRQVFVDYQRNKNSWKRGGRIQCFALRQNAESLACRAGNLVDFNDCMENLHSRFPTAARALDMQVFLQLEVSEIAAAMDKSKSHIEKQLRLAKATMASLMEER